LTLPANSAELAAHISSYFVDAPSLDPPTRDDLISEALWSVQDLRLAWLDMAPATPTLRVEAKPGRNELCPCGSGKKFKKCHGA
jgi:uncharacterized protein